VNNFVSVNCLVVCAVKSSDLKWLPEGSQLSMASPGQSGNKQKTFTSFSQSQNDDTLQKPLGVKVTDIVIARLGPGQVCVTCFTGTIMI
jgi:DNA-directed RNA polymerase I and III subunit RPAC1